MDATVYLRRPSSRAWLGLGLLVFLVAVNLKYVAKITDGSQAGRSAIVRWHDQLSDLWDGADIWARHGHPHPPIAALTLAPLSRLSPTTAALVWFYLKLGMAVAAVAWIFMVAREETSLPLWAMALALALSLRPIQGDLTHGNVNLVILFLLAASLAALRRSAAPRGRPADREMHLGNTRACDMLAGLFLALAASWKITPLLFLPYLLWKRLWHAAAAMAAGILFWTWLVPGIFLGFENNHRFLGSWYAYMVAPYAETGEPRFADHKNQSLPGLAHRLLSDSPSFTEYDFATGRYVPLEHHNLVSWPAPGVRAVVFGCFVVYLVAMMVVIRPGFRSLLAEFSLVALGMLLFSERTWKHHAVTLLFPVTTLCLAMASTSLPRLARGCAAASLLLALAGITLTSGVFGERFADVAMAYGAWTWSFVALLAGIGLVARFTDTEG